MNDVSLDMALGLMSRIKGRLGFVLAGRHLDDMDRRQINKALTYLDEISEYIGKLKAERREDEKRLSLERQPTATQEDGRNRTSTW
jgi:hypothetical protein